MSAAQPPATRPRPSRPKNSAGWLVIRRTALEGDALLIADEVGQQGGGVRVVGHRADVGAGVAQPDEGGGVVDQLGDAVPVGVEHGDLDRFAALPDRFVSHTARGCQDLGHGADAVAVQRWVSSSTRRHAVGLGEAGRPRRPSVGVQAPSGVAGDLVEDPGVAGELRADVDLPRATGALRDECGSRHRRHGG